MKYLFFCGHKSLYGASHIEPLISNSRLELVGIVLATDERWRKFGENLQGKQYSSRSKLNMLLRPMALPKKVLRRLLRIFGNTTIDSFALPDRPDVEKIADRHGISIHYVDNVNSEEFLEFLDKIGPDLIICSAYPQIFGKEFLRRPKLGAINFHPSLLPKFRGAHPHFWAIHEGEEKSGITAHFMTENVDDGDIIAQIEFPIRQYNYPELYKRIIEETPKLVSQVCGFFTEEQGKPLKQDDSIATYYRNNRTIHHRIFWNIQTVSEIYNLVRTGKAFCFFRNRKMLISKCYLSETNRNLTNNIKVENGTIVDIYKDSVAVKAQNGCINIELLSYNGERMSFLTFAQKNRVEVGEQFE